jgi:hypothetical protein
MRDVTSYSQVEIRRYPLLIEVDSSWLQISTIGVRGYALPSNAEANHANQQVPVYYGFGCIIHCRRVDAYKPLGRKMGCRDMNMRNGRSDNLVVFILTTIGDFSQN